MTTRTTLAHARPARERTNLDVALWAVIAIATTLFALFVAAYVMRVREGDAAPLALPWQLVLSTALLAAGSVALQRAVHAGRRARWSAARIAMLVGGSGATAFLVSQLGAWRALQAAHVGFAGNVAASFFYLLTAAHGVHVFGGLVAWALAAQRLATIDAGSDERTVTALRLCARYWHFLLAVWLLLYATLAGWTPALVAVVCGSPEALR